MRLWVMIRILRIAVATAAETDGGQVNEIARLDNADFRGAGVWLWWLLSTGFNSPHGAIWVFNEYSLRSGWPLCICRSGVTDFDWLDVVGLEAVEV